MNAGWFNNVEIVTAEKVGMETTTYALCAPKEKWTDGVVMYESAHIEGVASELIIKNSGHSAQDTPEAIEEVRRILIENLKDPE